MLAVLIILGIGLARKTAEDVKDVPEEKEETTEADEEEPVEEEPTASVRIINLEERIINPAPEGYMPPEEEYEPQEVDFNLVIETANDQIELANDQIERVDHDDELVDEEEIKAYVTPSDMKWLGTVNYDGWKWTYYSQRVLPGGGLSIPGRHVDSDGFVCDENEYICLASTVVEDKANGAMYWTPFGRWGKVYDYCGGVSVATLDVYVDW